MKVTMTVVLLAAALAAAPALAQEWRSQEHGSQSGATEPPGGSYQGYLGQDERLGDQQQAQVPEETTPHRDPGTLRKFNSNTGYGPEVQFDEDRREAAKRRAEQGPQGR
jgi:hypothetical protein